MTTSGYRERLRGPLEDALDRHARAQAERAPLIPGAIFLFPETAEWSVFWVVLEYDSDGERYLVVAADPNLLVGSSDIDGGDLSLRCSFKLWLNVEDFDAAHRTGTLEPEILQRARRKTEEIAAGEPTGSGLQRETDGDSEYQDWLDVLGRAQAQLLRKRRQRDVAEVVKAFPVPVKVGFSHPYAIAASILLVLSLGLAGGVVWQGRKIDDLERALAPPPPAETILNMPFALLRPRDVRGEATRLELPSGARFIHLILAVSDPEPYPEYRLDIGKEGAGTPDWSYGGLRLTGIAEISVALPVALFSAKVYELRLYGLRGAESELLGEYALEVETRPEKNL